MAKKCLASKCFAILKILRNRKVKLILWIRGNNFSKTKAVCSLHLTQFECKLPWCCAVTCGSGCCSSGCILKAAFLVQCFEFSTENALPLWGCSVKCSDFKERFPESSHVVTIIQVSTFFMSPVKKKKAKKTECSFEYTDRYLYENRFPGKRQINLCLSVVKLFPQDKTKDIKQLNLISFSFRVFAFIVIFICYSFLQSKILVHRRCMRRADRSSYILEFLSRCPNFFATPSMWNFNACTSLGVNLAF